MHVKGFDKDAWQKVRKDARAGMLKKVAKPLIATDISPGAIDAAKKNAQTAGVDSMIGFQVSDYRQTELPEEKGIIVLNPAYGLRLGEEKKRHKKRGMTLTPFNVEITLGNIEWESIRRLKRPLDNLRLYLLII